MLVPCAGGGASGAGLGASLFVLAFLLPSLSVGQPVPAVVNINATAIVHVTAREYLSFNFDYHLDTEVRGVFNHFSLFEGVSFFLR